MRKNKHLDSKISRIVNGAKITILCAPPGYQKMKIAQLAMAHLSAQSGVECIYFGASDHIKNPKGLAEQLENTNKPGLFLVENPALLDGHYLQSVLTKIMLQKIPHHIIICQNFLTDFCVSKLKYDGFVEVLNYQFLEISAKEAKDSHVGQLKPKIRKKIQQLAEEWPIALDILTGFAQENGAAMAGLSDKHIIAMSGISHFIQEEIAPFFSEQDYPLLHQIVWWIASTMPCCN